MEPPQLSKPAARALLNLVQLAAGALAVGGEARASVSIGEDRAEVIVEAAGPRARLHEEVAVGLRGEPLGEGLSGRWVQAYYLHGLVKSAGGTVTAVAGEDRVSFRAMLPV